MPAIPPSGAADAATADFTGVDGKAHTLADKPVSQTEHAFGGAMTTEHLHPASEARFAQLATENNPLRTSPPAPGRRPPATGARQKHGRTSILA